MNQNQLNQWTITNIGVDDQLTIWVEAFLLDRKSQNMSRGTLYFYQAKLKVFCEYCEGQVIDRINQITPDTIRRYLLWLEETGHNAGGIHAFYRSLKTFLLWFEAETEPGGWKNPIRKVKAPKNPVQVIEPVELETVQEMIKACRGSGFTAVRDRALLYFLIDTGARASEVCAVDLADIDQVSGSVMIRMGKGRKPRMVYMEQTTRRAVRAYLKQRKDKNPSMWVTDDQEGRLTYWGLNEVVSRRAAKAGVKKPGLHDFRRCFCLSMLRNGCDIYSLQKMMGHADIQVLRRYLAQTDADIQQAHQRAGIVDKGLK